MKVRIWCLTHRRWHSKHAALHCRKQWKRGECKIVGPRGVDAYGRTREERCPLQPEGR